MHGQQNIKIAFSVVHCSAQFTQRTVYHSPNSTVSPAPTYSTTCSQHSTAPQSHSTILTYLARRISVILRPA